MSSVFAQFNRFYNQARNSQESESSWWKSVGSIMGSMFVGDEEKRRGLNLEESVLLIFYEAVHLNRNFIGALTHAATEFSTTSHSSIENGNNSKLGNELVGPSEVNLSLDSAQLNQATNMRLLNPLSLSMNAGLADADGKLLDLNSLDQAISNAAALRQAVNPPSNLLVIFLESCSAILQETKIDSNYDTIKMFLVILTCVTEDNYANSILHDSSILYSVFLYQAVLIFT